MPTHGVTVESYNRWHRNSLPAYLLWNDIGIYIFRQAICCHHCHKLCFLLEALSPSPGQFPLESYDNTRNNFHFLPLNYWQLAWCIFWPVNILWNNKHHLEISDCISHYFHKLDLLITVNYWLIFHACIAIAAYSKCVLSHLITLSFAKAMVHLQCN